MREAQELVRSEARVYDVDSPSSIAIDELEAALVTLPQADQLVVHRFAGGIYSRECFSPAHMPVDENDRRKIVATSRIHKHEHHGVLTLGVAAILQPNGKFEVMRAPFHFITPAGTRRVLMILEDCICTTFHRTDLTDLAALDEFLYLPGEGPKRHAARAKKKKP